MSSKIGFAVFGLGRMGQIHAKNIVLSNRASLKWIVRNDLQGAKKFASDLDLTTQCTTPDNQDVVLNDPGVDAVFVCSPTLTHEPFIRSALEAGKAVLCEKPVTPDLESTAACYDLAQKKNLPLLCALHRQFDPSFRKVFDKVKAGDLGRVRIMKATSRDPQPPPLSYIKTSGGILNDSTIHDLNLSMWMARSKPETVYAEGVAFDPEIGKYDNDQILVTIKYQNGVLSSIDNGRVAAYGYDQRLEVLCENGGLEVSNRDSDHVTELGSHVTSVPRIHSGFDRYSEAYVNVLEHFLDVMQGKSELQIKKEDLVSTMKLVKACQKSIDTKAPVSFNSI